MSPFLLTNLIFLTRYSFMPENWMPENWMLENWENNDNYFFQSSSKRFSSCSFL